VRTLRADDIVLEVGSGVGYITTIAARIAREVRAYEANPMLVDVGRATVARSGCRAAIEAGVLARSPTATTTDFYLADEFWVSSLIASTGARRIRVPVHDFADAC
jgi:predicted RNA methylase